MERFTRIKSRLGLPSPALVVGCIAVVLALGGTASALNGTNTVDQGDLQTGSVGAPEIKTGAVRKAEINDGAVQDAELGDIIVRTATTPIADGASGRAEATCDPGERIIGGGGEWQQSGTDAMYHGDHPSTGGGTRATNGNDFTHWNAKGTNLPGANASLDLIAYAICLQ